MENQKEALDVIVRVAQVEDARAIIGLSQEVGSQTPYLTFGKTGIDLTVAEEADLIRRYHQAQNSLLIITEVDDQIVGMANVTEGNNQKQRHVGELGICLVKEYWGYGLASMMMDMLMDFVAHSGLKVLTLEVVKENQAAIKLYQRYGFTQVGTMSKRLNVDGIFYDSYLMEKVLQ